MAQVSDPATSPQEGLSSLRTRDPGQNQRTETQQQGKEAQEANQKEDRVQISREAQEQDRGSRVEEGKRNVDNLRPQSEQIENERGAAQKLRDQESNSAQANREFEQSSVQAESQSARNSRSEQTEASRESQAQTARAAEENPDVVEQQAADNKNAEVQLREFQTKDEVRIEPKIVAESVDEIKVQREKAEAAKEPALEAPSQRIIQDDSSTRPESARSGGENEQEGSNRQPPSPASAQTETGQNIDDLI